MATWNKVLMRYCDGASFSGNNATVEVYQGKPLHWKGMKIREGVVADLTAKHGLGKASDIVVSGCSAGASAFWDRGAYFQSKSKSTSCGPRLLFASDRIALAWAPPCRKAWC